MENLIVKMEKLGPGIALLSNFEGYENYMFFALDNEEEMVRIGCKMANLNPTENPPIPYITGDPDDHEVGDILLWPGKLGCLIWGVSASTILCVGSGLVRVRTEPFNFPNEGKLAVAVATALLAWPAASLFWMIHLDSKHYGRFVDHFHLEAAVPKAVWNTVAWAGNSLIQAGKNLRKPK